jgi:hypothetical protein
MSTFFARLEAATAVLGADNVLDVAQGKAFLKDNEGSVLFLNVQDPGSDAAPSSYNCSLGTLFYKADPNGPAPDPKICGGGLAQPILVSCAAGGQGAFVFASGGGVPAFSSFENFSRSVLVC